MRMSGLQLDVLRLYRDLLKVAKTKPLEQQKQWKEFIRFEFEKGKGMSRNNFMGIEHAIRSGRKKLELFKSPHVTTISRKGI
eukprot:m.20622 g.20622  ORF g.20622 m.20622 type:complete len:82 (+) comp6901_c0_seq1:145-390(+)